MNMSKSDVSTLRIAVVGRGNVGTHLTRALAQRFTVVNIDSRNLHTFPEDCDVALICVSDKVIPEMAKSLKGKAGIIAHTSGSVPMEVLEDNASSYGVFYPMQTFTKDSPMEYADIPFFIEGNNRETVSILSEIASNVSSSVNEADSAQRKRLHLASVFACNFSNHLVGIADSILKEGGMNYTILLPLLRRTIQKLESLSPAEAQTGPAAREEYPILEAHLRMLESTPERQELYRLLSSDIINSKRQQP